MSKRRILPPALLGIVLGLGLFTFQYGEGLSYFSADPVACVNCHIMQPQYDSWQKASHHTTATCVDCHLPAKFIPKWLAKAENGYLHSKAFTFQDFAEPIIVRARNKDALRDNCLRCHSTLLHETQSLLGERDEVVNCVHCHRTAGHGETTGLGRFEPGESPQTIPRSSDDEE